MNAQALVITVVLAVTILLAAIVFVLLTVIRKSTSPLIRVLAATATALSLLLSPGVVDAIVVRSNRSPTITYATIDPGWILKLAPAVISIVFAAILIARAAKHATSRTR